MWFEHSNITREEGVTHQNEAWIPPSQSATQGFRGAAVTLRLCFRVCSWGSGSKKRIANSDTASHRLCFQSPEAAAARKESLTVTQQVTVCVSSRLRQRQFIVWLSSSKLWTTPGLSPQEHQMGNDLQTVSASSLSRSSNWLTYESRNNAFMMPRLPNSSIWDQISELMGKSPNSWGKTIYWRVLVDL